MLYFATVIKLVAMPSAHRIALKKLLDTVQQRIAEYEARIVRATNDEERAKLVEEIADLHVRKSELMEALAGE
jgi:phosphoribosyl-ATP pyrophosphohydrolase